MDELEWEPSVNAAHIGVTANKGVVTLTGHVHTYTEKLAAERAVGRVVGVKAVAEELEVRSPFDTPDDEDIAKSAVQALSLDSQIPDNSVTVKVEKRWVTLSGRVDWHYQSRAAVEDVRKIRGVVRVVDSIKIKPRLGSNVCAEVKAALARNSQIHADDITVATDGNKVTLTGNVHSFYERCLAVDTAWSAFGVAQVDDRLTVI
jgi:osmotically-inducible protein OsmY